MAAALMHSKHLHPSAHGPNVRDISKLGDWKCAERKSFFLQYFLPLFQGLYKTPEDISLVTSGIRAARLHQTRVIDRSAPYDEALRTYDFDDAGEFVTPYANLVVANDEWLRRREAALTNRQAKFGALSTPTTVRSQHLPEMALMWAGISRGRSGASKAASETRSDAASQLSTPSQTCGTTSWTPRS